MPDPYQFVKFAGQTGQNLRDISNRNLRRNAFSTIDSPGDMRRGMQTLGAGGDVQGFNAMSDLYAQDLKTRQTREAAAAKQLGESQELAQKGYKWLKGALPGIVDEKSYQVARFQHDQMFGADDTIPANYDPEYVGQLKKMMVEAEQPTGTPTDIDDFVARANEESFRTTGKNLTPGEMNEAALMFKRAQQAEVAGVRTAQLQADLGLKPQIAGAVEAAEARVQTETGAGVKEASATGGLIAANNMAMYESANNAVSQVGKIDDLIKQIEDSAAITGFGAELFKNIERVKASIGSEVAAGKVTDTEILDAMMGSEVFPLIKSLGIGARGMDTPAERKFLRQVMTGQIDLNKATLLRMAKMRRSVAERSLKRYNQRVASGSLNNFFKYTGIPKAKIEFENVAPQPGPKTITTQAGYDSLPSGAIYTEDGQQYRKP